MTTEKIPGTGITFKKGGLHQSVGVPQGSPIPAGKMRAALQGRYGPKARRQAQLAQTLKGMRPSGSTAMAKAAAGK
jgi:hypothetical protein